MKNKIIVVLIVILAAVLFGVWMFQKNKQAAVPKANQDQAAAPAKTQTADFSSPVPIVVEVPTGQLPGNFPADVPVEKGAVIISNLNATTPQGQKVAVREFVSKKTLQENFGIYKKYLTDSGYKIVDNIFQPDQAIISGDKGGYRLRVRIYKDGSDVKVTINYVKI